MERGYILACRVQAHAAEAVALRNIAAAMRQRIEAVQSIATCLAMEAESLGDEPEARLIGQYLTIAQTEVRTLETEAARYDAEAARADAQSRSAELKRAALEQRKRLGFVHT